MNSENNLQLSSAHQQFIDYLVTLQRAKATVIAYSKDIEQLIAFLADMGKKSISQIQRDDLEAFLKKLTSDGYTLKSLSRKINSIKTFYRFLKNKNFVILNPAADITHPKYNIKPPRILSKMEYRALRDACRSDIRTYTIVELFLQTGVRIGELANLKTNSVKERERVVPLNRAGKESLEKWLAIRPKSEDPSLFVTKTGKPLLVRNIRTTIDRYFKLAGIEGAKVNDLRHTFIAHHLASGTPLTVISKLVGHKRLSTTEKYLDLVKDKMNDNIKLDEL